MDFASIFAGGWSFGFSHSVIAVSFVLCLLGDSSSFTQCCDVAGLGPACSVVLACRRDTLTVAGSWPVN